MEELHSDLIPYSDGRMVHHRLIVGSLLRDASHMNQVYRQKKELVAKAEADGDWNSYVFLHEKPYRLGALERAEKKGLSHKPSAFWGLVGEVWWDSENIHQNLAK